MTALHFILANFIVAACSDVVLNYLSRISVAPKSIRALGDYFRVYNPLYAAFNAGITVVIVLLITMGLSYVLMDILYPQTRRELFRFVVLAFLLGFIADVIIDHYRLFGTTLNKFYRIAGAGFWGAMAFVFSIIISYGILHIASMM